MNVVTLQEIENFDSHPQKNGEENRFLCSLSASCREKPRDAAHRSLCVNTRTGFFVCHRCHAKGKLKDFWEERPLMNKRQMSRLKLAAQFSAPVRSEQKIQHGTCGNSVEQKVEISTKTAFENWQNKMASYQAVFAESPAENYLIRRGISSEVARTANCGYAAAWEHWEKREEKWLLIGIDKRVVFPIYDSQNELVAIHGRAIEDNYFGSPKITKGDKSFGLFATPPEALKAKVVAVCEGQSDALALQTCGVAAVAMTGTTAPDWLLKKLAFRKVLLATDADQAGDRAAAKLRDELEMRACKTFRLRPRGAKDWAEVLQKIGREKLTAALTAFSLNANDEVRMSNAFHLQKDNRREAAKFILTLIENNEAREWLREKLEKV